MKKLDQLFTAIALEHLGMATLKTRYCDALDFHTVAVWQVRASLKAAFETGARIALLPQQPAPGIPAKFDTYEIQPCRRYRDADEPDIAFVEPCESCEADFWTLYGHIPGSG